MKTKWVCVNAVQRRLEMDLNILISTIVTATAALVAIIGGFLVSRVITMSSERKGIERRVREIRNDLLAKRDIYENAEEILLEEDVDDFIRDNLEELVKREKTLEEIVEDDDYNNRSIEELQPYLEKLEQLILEVEGMVNGSYRDDISNDFESFLKDEQIKVKYPQEMYLYKDVFYYIKKTLPKRQANPLISAFPDVHQSVMMKPSLISSIGPVNHQLYRDKKKNRDTLKDEVKILTLQLEEQEKILEDYAKPRGFWGGLIVLIYASIIGVAYPTTLLPYPMNTYDDGATKWLLVSLFVSQLVVLFAYLTFEMYRMTKSENYS